MLEGTVVCLLYEVASLSNKVLIDAPCRTALLWRECPRLTMALWLRASTHCSQENARQLLVWLSSTKFTCVQESLMNGLPRSTLTPICWELLLLHIIRHVCEEIVAPISYSQLVELGNLVPSRTFAPNTIDRKSIGKNGGEFSATESDTMMRKRHIVGNTVQQYLTFGDNRPALCFAVTKQHAHVLCDQFIHDGVPADVITADTPDEERSSILEKSKAGIIKVICNVMVLSVGVDMPWISCVIAARPTCSEVLWVQMLGRGSRPFPEKKDFIVLDQAGNTSELGFVEEHRQAAIDGYQRKHLTKNQVLTRTCKKCFAVFAAKEKCCPYCKAEHPVKLIEHTDGTLTEIIPEKIIRLSEDLDKALSYANQLRAIAREKSYAPGWVFFKLKCRYSERIVRQVLSR
jgi:DNA repair protein RadD